jgi:hypothetical protein
MRVPRISRRVTFANVASALALFIAIGGGTAFGLAGRNTVTSDDIVPANVRTSDIARNAVTASKINNAAPGIDAVNADKLDGISGENYQLGDGISGGEGFVQINNGAAVNPLVGLSGGHLSFTCGNPTSTLAYIDNASSGFDTDVWEGQGTGNHSTVTDGGSKTDLIPTGTSGTVRFQVFAEVVDDVTFSWFFDPTSTPNPNRCTVAVSTQTNGYPPALTPRKHGHARPAGPRPAP